MSIYVCDRVRKDTRLGLVDSELLEALKVSTTETYTLIVGLPLVSDDLTLVLEDCFPDFLWF